MIDLTATSVNTRSERTWLGPLVAALLVGLVASPLLIGFEPVGGDPDRAYRPIKMELAQALAEGTLPYWSDQFGTGMPLIAESHVAAFYPPNWVLYGLFDVATAYRLAMWLHLVACAAVTAVYALRCGSDRWGSALVGVAFTFCGFQAIHASHEFSYCAVVYLPLCLWLCERYVETGAFRWVAALALSSGVQWTIGHFQIQTWTAGLVLTLGTYRVLSDGRPCVRLGGLIAAVGWAMAVAAVQLWPSMELAQYVGQFHRSIEARSFYSYPPAHFAELALPRLFRNIPGGPDGPYWIGQQTTGYEAALFIGTIPFIFACLGALQSTRALRPWFALILGSLLLATMSHWWPDGYAVVLRLPGIGFFRAPGRYTIVASLGLALLAGRGLERSSPSQTFQQGLILAAGFGVLSLVWAIWWTSRPQFEATFSGQSAVIRFGVPVVTWSIALVAILQWKRGNWPVGVILVLTAVEAAGLYYVTAPKWGWHIPIQKSPVLSRLEQEETLGRVGGDLENYPIYAGASTASPYLGFAMPAPNDILLQAGRRHAFHEPGAVRWLRRLGVTHLVWSGEERAPENLVITRMTDEILDQVVGHPPSGKTPEWTIVKLSAPFPPARAVTRTHVSSDGLMLIRRLSLLDEPDTAHYLPGDLPRAFSDLRARHAVVIRWDGHSGVVDHDGSCDLIINRTFYPGWSASVNGKLQNVHRVDGGLQAVRLEGIGPTRIEMVYQTSGRRISTATSLFATLSAIAVLVAARWRKREIPPGPAPADPVAR